MIKIIKVPDGEAPEEVRKAWVGLILPLAFTDNIKGYVKEVGLVSQEFLPERDIVAVPGLAAIYILEKNDPDAAKWFIQQGIPKKIRFLTFSIDEVKIL